MSLFEYSEKFFQINPSSKNVHYCKCCPYFSTSIFFMINHVRRHRAPKRRFDCANTPETYFCKDCDFRTTLTVLFKKHIRENHARRRHQPRAPTDNPLVRRYICAECNFATFFSLKLMEHVARGCLKDKVDLFGGPSAPRPKPPEPVTVAVTRKRSVRAVAKPPSDSQRFLCDKCPYRSRRKFILAAHKMDEHLGGTGKWRKCDQCSFKADKLSHLKRHKIMKHLEDDEIEWFVCVYCPFQGKQRQFLRKHVGKEHPGEEYAEIRRGNAADVFLRQCKHCPSKFQWMDTLKVHLLAKHGAEDATWHKCDKCDYKTKNPADLTGHQADRHVKAPTWLQCKYCIYKTKFQRNLDSHVASKHPKASTVRKTSNGLKIPQSLVATRTTPIQWYHCDKCDYKTKNPPDLARHHTLKHVKVATWLQCKYCIYRTKYQRNLDSHVSSKHPKASPVKKSSSGPKIPPALVATPTTTDIKWYDCDKCSYKTRYSADLQKHFKVKHPHEDEIVWFRCQYCPFGTKFEFSLNAHVKMHQKTSQPLDGPPVLERQDDLASTDVKWYHCDKCPHRTKYSNNLRKHQARIHVDKDESLQCKYCPFMTQSKRTLDTHLLKNHTKLVDKFAERPKPQTNSIVTRSSGAKWQHCDKCSYKSKHIADVRKHTSLKHKHNDVDWFQCEYCPFKAKFQQALYGHWSKHAKEIAEAKRRLIKSRKEDSPPLLSLQDDIEVKSPKGAPPRLMDCVNEAKFKPNLNGHVLRKPRLSSSLKSPSVPDTKPEPSVRKDAQVVFQCMVCSCKLKGKEDLRRHMLSEHPKKNGVDWHTCDRCPYKTKFLRDLHHHIIRLHLEAEDVQWFACNHCEFAAKVHRDLKSHILSRHPEEKHEVLSDKRGRWTTFACELCPAIVQGEEAFQGHVANHSKPKEKKAKGPEGKQKKKGGRVTCKDCSMTLVSSAHLARHVISRHTDEKDIHWFCCQFCSFRAKRSDGLKDHVRNRHRGKSVNSIKAEA